MKFYSDITHELYDTAEACAAAEQAQVKAEEAKKNAYTNAVAELEEKANFFKACKKKQDEAYKQMSEAATSFRKNGVEFQRKYGHLPEKYYADYILARLL